MTKPSASRIRSRTRVRGRQGRAELRWSIAPSPVDMLQAVAEASPLAIITVDRQHRVVTWPPAAEHMFGWRADEVLGRRPPQIPPESADEFAALLDRESQGESFSGLPVTRMRRDGSRFPVELWTAPLRNTAGEIVGFLHLLADVTKHREAAAEMIHQQGILQALLDYTPAVIFVKDLDGRYLLINRQHTHLHRRTLADVYGRRDEDVFPPEQAAAYRANDRLIIAHGRPQVVEEKAETEAGQRTFVVVKFPIRDQDGQIYAVGGVGTDITERKLAELSLRELNATLERRVAERTAELESVNQQLAERNQEIELFVHSVSHDLRSPLINLQGFCAELTMAAEQLGQLLHAARPGADTRREAVAQLNDMRESMQFIESAGGTMQRMLTALLRLSRFGRVELQFQEVNLDELVRGVLRVQGAEIARRRAEVILDRLGLIHADPTALEQVFSNLVANAIGYLSPQRAGKIEIGRLAEKSDSRLATGVRFRTYYVRDNGTGIPKALHHKLFQPFERLQPGLADGEGIGLMLVRRIVERHGGTIWFESDVDQGATFFLRLPDADLSDLV